MAGKRVRRKKRKFVFLIIEIFILAVVVVGLYYYSRLNLIQQKDIDTTKVATNQVTEEMQVAFEGTTTIACFGLDNREMGDYGSGNSDVIMVFNIDNDTKEVSLVSVYRDTYLNIASADSSSNLFRKANSAYANGGAEQAITMLNRNLDLDVDDYISFDFKAVADAIDILGGVEVNIESEKELDCINDYIPWTNDYIGGDWGDESELIESTGTQLLDGVQAVSYARIRYTSGGDFKRAERQRLVLSQMVNKAKNANVSQLTELVNTVFPQIETSLGQKEMLSMISAMVDYDMSNSQGFPFDRTTMDISPAGDIVVPCDLESNVIQLHKVLFGQEDYTPSETVKEYSEIITENTGKTADSTVIEDDFQQQDSFDGSGTLSSSQRDSAADEEESDSDDDYEDYDDYDDEE